MGAASVFFINPYLSGPAHYGLTVFTVIDASLEVEVYSSLL